MGWCGAQPAVINGRSAHDASKSDLKQAIQELASELGTDPKAAVLESPTQAEGCDEQIERARARTEQAETRTEQAQQ
jgi:phage terminase small subunit